MELEYGVEELIISKGITLDEFISNLFLANRIIVFEDINDYVRLFSHKKESLIPKSDFYASDEEDGYQILRVYSSEKRYYIKKIVLNEQIIKIAITNENLSFLFKTTKASFFGNSATERGVWEVNLKKILIKKDKQTIKEAFMNVLPLKERLTITKEFVKAIKYKSSFFTEIEFRKKNEENNFYIYGKYCKNLVGDDVVIGEVINNTKRNKLMKRCIHDEKIKSLGYMAGGIAHDINNRLMGISGSAKLLEKYIDEKGKKYLTMIDSIAFNTKDLIRRLLEFSQNEEVEMYEFDIKRMIDDTIDIFKHSCGLKINIKKDIDLENSIFLGNRGMIQNGIISLLINSYDALQDKKKPIIIKARDVYLDHVPEKSFFKVLDANGFYLKLDIIDFGRGIKEKNIDKIFDPFYTTKGLANGTGLGLSSVLNMIKKHNGIIEVDSKEYSGTIISIYLPVLDKNNNNLESERVLIVDDEEMVRIVVKDFLKEESIKSISFARGEDAISYAKNNKNLEIGIIDMIMPEMDGLKVIKSLHAINPKMRFIILTGYYEKSILDNIDKDIKVKILSKPVMYDVLIENVRSMFGEERLNLLEENKIIPYLLEDYLNSHSYEINSFNILSKEAKIRIIQDISHLFSIIGNEEYKNKLDIIREKIDKGQDDIDINLLFKKIVKISAINEKK